MKATKKPELWKCPQCAETFTTTHLWHSCGSFELEPLFENCDPLVHTLFDRFVAAARNSGPVTVIPQKSRIALQVRMRFAALMPLKHALKGHLVLARRHDSPRFERVETYSQRNHVHVFRLVSEGDFDKELCSLIAEAYDVGCQMHL